MEGGLGAGSVPWAAVSVVPGIPSRDQLRGNYRRSGCNLLHDPMKSLLIYIPVGTILWNTWYSIS